MAAAKPAKGAADEHMTYPAPKTVEQVDDYHGTKVKDPYRWLESLDSPDTRSWVEAENKLTFGYLEKIPQREKLQARLTELWNYERYSPPFHEGGRYFYSKNDGLQNQNVLWRQLEGKPAEVFLDPNTLSSDGTTALDQLSFSRDGKLLAYITRQGNAFKLMTQDLETGTVRGLSDTVDDESPSFAPNGRLLVYATRQQGRDVLMTTTLDGKIKARLVSTTADVREPTWGPYGR